MIAQFRESIQSDINGIAVYETHISPHPERYVESRSLFVPFPGLVANKLVVRGSDQ
jgi:hypothetical protein